MGTVKDCGVLACCFIAVDKRCYLPAEYIVDLYTYPAILNELITDICALD